MADFKQHCLTERCGNAINANISRMCVVWPNRYVCVQDALVAASQGEDLDSGSIPPFPGLACRPQSVPNRLSELSESESR